MLQSTGSQRVRHHLALEQQQQSWRLEGGPALGAGWPGQDVDQGVGRATSFLGLQGRAAP